MVLPAAKDQQRLIDWITSYEAIRLLLPSDSDIARPTPSAPPMSPNYDHNDALSLGPTSPRSPSPGHHAGHDSPGRDPIIVYGDSDIAQDVDMNNRLMELERTVKGLTSVITVMTNKLDTSMNKHEHTISHLTSLNDNLPSSKCDRSDPRDQQAGLEIVQALRCEQ